jgi:hypothetical protein
MVWRGCWCLVGGVARQMGGRVSHVTGFKTLREWREWTVVTVSWREVGALGLRGWECEEYLEAWLGYFGWIWRTAISDPTADDVRNLPRQRFGTRVWRIIELMRTWRSLRCKYLRAARWTVGSCREERCFCFLHRAPLHEEATWREARREGKEWQHYARLRERRSFGLRIENASRLGGSVAWSRLQSIRSLDPSSLVLAGKNCWPRTRGARSQQAELMDLGDVGLLAGERLKRPPTPGVD